MISWLVVSNFETKAAKVYDPHNASSVQSSSIVRTIHQTLPLGGRKVHHDISLNTTCFGRKMILLKGNKFIVGYRNIIVH